MKAETIKRVGEILEEAIENGVTMGASVGVWQHGKELLYVERGLADRENEKKIKRDTIFRLYSMSKPITAAAAMILMERGLLDFAQPVSDFLPGFAEVMVEKDGGVQKSETPVTVLNLLNMTSGLTYGDEKTTAGKMTLGYIEECIRRLHTPQAVTTAEFAEHLSMIPLDFVPDTSWRYGLSADVLGAVIEKASGMRFGEFMEKNIFEPLGMKDTGFWVPKEKQDRLAQAYELADGPMKLYTGDNLAVSNCLETPPAFESGGAGLVSTMDDYAKFAQMLLGGGVLDGVRVMNQATADYFTDGGLTPDQQKAYRAWVGLEGFTYSHLMRILKHPEMAAYLGSRGEYGWDGWLGCYFANLPEKDATILLMQQRRDSGTIPMTRKVRNVILGDL